MSLFDYCNFMKRYDEEELRAKYLQNINKGILINKDYSRKGSRNSKNEKKGSKLSNTFEKSYTPGSSFYNKMNSMRVARTPQEF